MRALLFVMQKWLLIALSIILAVVIVDSVLTLSPGQITPAGEAVIRPDIMDIWNGDYGDSVRSARPASDLVEERSAASWELLRLSSVLSVVIAIVLSLPLLSKQRIAIFGSQILTWLLLAVPIGLMALALLWYLGIHNRVFPVGGRAPVSVTAQTIPALFERLDYLVLPVLSMALVWGAATSIFIYYRYHRSGSMRGQDMLHAVLVALPVITSSLISTLPLIEMLFSFPGVGRLLGEAVMMSDFPTMAAAFMWLVWRAGLSYAVLVVPLAAFVFITGRPVTASVLASLGWFIDGRETITATTEGDMRAKSHLDDRVFSGCVTVVFNGLAVIAGIGLLVCLLVVYAPALVTESSATEMNLALRLLPPGTEGYIFGTDSMGRDVLARTLYGGGTTLRIAWMISGIALVTGGILGLLGGTVTGRSSILLGLPLHALSVFSITVPLLPLLLLISSISPASDIWVIGAGVCGSAGVGLLVREMFGIRSQTSRRQWGSLFGCVLALAFAFGIITEVSMGILGLSVQPPLPSWGNLFSDARLYLQQAPALIAAPALFVVSMLVCLQIIAARLRDNLPV